MPGKQVHTISVRVADDLKADLERLAKADDRKLSAYINRVLRQHVETEKAKTPKN